MKPTPSTNTAIAQPGFANVRCAFLDRDGVINRKMPEGRYVSHWRDFELLPGVPEAIARLNRVAVRTIVVTNQRGIALGYYTEQDVELIHSQFREHLLAAGARVDAIYHCPHDIDRCNCRKPLPGLFQRAFSEFPECNPQNSIVIGDSLSDIRAGVDLGMRTIFIRGAISIQKSGSVEASTIATATGDSLIEVVEKFLV